MTCCLMDPPQMAIFCEHHRDISIAAFKSSSVSGRCSISGSLIAGIANCAVRLEQLEILGVLMDCQLMPPAQQGEYAETAGNRKERKVATHVSRSLVIIKLLILPFIIKNLGHNTAHLLIPGIKSRQRPVPSGPLTSDHPFSIHLQRNIRRPVTPFLTLHPCDSRKLDFHLRLMLGIPHPRAQLKWINPTSPIPLRIIQTDHAQVPIIIDTEHREAPV